MPVAVRAPFHQFRCSVKGYSRPVIFVGYVCYILTCQLTNQVWAVRARYVLHRDLIKVHPPTASIVVLRWIRRYGIAAPTDTAIRSAWAVVRLIAVGTDGVEFHIAQLGDFDHRYRPSALHTGFDGSNRLRDFGHDERVYGSSAVLADVLAFQPRCVPPPFHISASTFIALGHTITIPIPAHPCSGFSTNSFVFISGSAFSSFQNLSTPTVGWFGWWMMSWKTINPPGLTLSL